MARSDRSHPDNIEGPWFGPAMRETGQDGWARRPATAFDWC